MLWLTYALLGLFFFLCSLLYAKIMHKDMRVARHVSIGTLCAACAFVVLYIPVHVVGRRIAVSETVPLSALSSAQQRHVFVLAVATTGDNDTKRDAYIINLNRDGFPAQGIFTEGEARLSFEERRDGILEKRSSRLVGFALWLTYDTPWNEYVIRVPRGSLERPMRVKNFW